MSDKKLLARNLYLTHGKTQKEIAIEVGVSERTIYTWIHQYAWQKLKIAAYQAPATISNNIASQLVEMQNAIAAREPGKRFPTKDEADITRKLILNMDTLKKQTSLAQNMQMMESFREFARPLNKQFSQQLAHYADKFLTAKSQGGYLPYQMAYGIDQSAAVTTFYDELEDEQPCDTANPPPYPVECTNMRDCGKTVGCNWPKCKHVYLNNDDPQENRIEDTPWAPIPAKLSTITQAPAEISTEPEKTPETLTATSVEPLPVPPPQPEETGSFPAISVEPCGQPNWHAAPDKTPEKPNPENYLANPNNIPVYNTSQNRLTRYSIPDPPAREVLGKG